METLHKKQRNTPKQGFPMPTYLIAVGSQKKVIQLTPHGDQSISVGPCETAQRAPAQELRQHHGQRLSQLLSQQICKETQQ